MKTTAYFQFRSQHPDRIHIKDEWILRVIKHPVCTIIQKDGRIKMWARIDEAQGRYLRVVTLEDGETVHNAFFDRNFTEGDGSEN